MAKVRDRSICLTRNCGLKATVPGGFCEVCARRWSRKLGLYAEEDDPWLDSPEERKRWGLRAKAEMARAGGSHG